MDINYLHKKIEAKWKKRWEENPVNPADDSKLKYYCLDMFPYPSANFAPLIDAGDLRPPFLSLIVSGGHTEIIGLTRWAVTPSWAERATTQRARPTTRPRG